MFFEIISLPASRTGLFPFASYPSSLSPSILSSLCCLLCFLLNFSPIAHTKWNYPWELLSCQSSGPTEMPSMPDGKVFVFVFAFAFTLKKCIKLFVEYSKKAYVLYQFSSTFFFPFPRLTLGAQRIPISLQFANHDIWLASNYEENSNRSKFTACSQHELRGRCTERRILYFIFQGIF